MSSILGYSGQIWDTGPGVNIPYRVTFSVDTKNAFICCASVLFVKVYR